MDTLKMNKEYDVREKFIVENDEYAEKKLDKYLGRKEEDSEFAEQDGAYVMNYKKNYYDKKIERYKALSNAKNKNLVDFSKTHKDRSAKKRATSAKTAEEHLKNSREIYYKLSLERDRYKKAEAGKEEIQNNIRALEDQLLEERYKATQKEIEVKSLNKSDEKMKLTKAKATHILCKLELMKERGELFSEEYLKLREEYNKNYKELAKFMGKEDKYRSGFVSDDLERKDARENRKYVQSLASELDTNKLGYCIGKMIDNGIISNSNRDSYNYLVGDGCKLMSEEVIRTRFMMMIEDVDSVGDVKAFIEYKTEKVPDKSMFWKGNDYDEESYNKYLFENANDSRSEEEYTKALEYVAKTKPGRDKDIEIKNSKVYQGFNYKNFVQNQPLQGWKLHVGVRNARDFYEAARVLVPEFIRLRISFKIVNVNKYTKDKHADYYKDKKASGNFIGKEFTIYPDENFNYEKFSDEAKAILTKPLTRRAATDKSFENSRLTARFGGFLGHNLMNPNGLLESDERDEIEGGEEYKAPSFVDESRDVSTITGFYTDIRKEYEEKNNIERYVNQYMLGIRLDKDALLPFGIIEVEQKEIPNLKKCIKKGEHIEDNLKYTQTADWGVAYITVDGQCYMAYPAVHKEEYEKLVKEQRK